MRAALDRLPADVRKTIDAEVEKAIAADEQERRDEIAALKLRIAELRDGGGYGTTQKA